MARCSLTRKISGRFSSSSVDALFFESTWAFRKKLKKALDRDRRVAHIAAPSLLAARKEHRSAGILFRRCRKRHWKM